METAPTNTTEKKPVGIKVIAILLIVIGVINILTLPFFIFGLQFSGRSAGKAFISDSQYEGGHFDNAKLKAYAESERGQKVIKEMDAINKSTWGFLAFLMICKKIIYCAALILGVGLLFLKDIARKITIVLSSVNIPIAATLGFLTYFNLSRGFNAIPMEDLAKCLKEPAKYSGSVMDFGQKVIVNMALVFIILGFIFLLAICAFMVIYLTRPRVKQAFLK